MCLVWTHLILFNVDVKTFVCFVLLLSTTRNYSCDVVFSDRHMHMCWCFLCFFRSFVFPNIEMLVFGNHDLGILCARCALRTKRALFFRTSVLCTETFVRHMHMCWCFLWFFRSFVFPNKKMFVFPNIDVLVFGNHDLSILCARCVLCTQRAQRHSFGSCCLKMTPNSQREMIVENSENNNTKERTNFTTNRFSVSTWTWVSGRTWEWAMVSGCRVSRTDTPLKDQEPSWWETTSISICHEL